MIRVRKIAHVTYETPDVERQTDYYTEILGLSLIAKERGAVRLNMLAYYRGDITALKSMSSAIRIPWVARCTSFNTSEQAT